MHNAKKISPFARFAEGMRKAFARPRARAATLWAKINWRDPAWKFLCIIIAVGFLLIHLMLPQNFIRNIFSSPEALMRVTLEAQDTRITTLDQEATTVRSNTFFIDTVDFPDGSEFRHTRLGSLHFSRDFFTTVEGEFDVLTAGEYRFIVASDDGFRLTIGETMVSEFTNDRPMTETEGRISLARGRHSFVIRHFQGFGGVGLQAWYIGPNCARQFMGQHSPCLRFVPWSGGKD
jgi:hypothetical protein